MNIQFKILLCFALQLPDRNKIIAKEDFLCKAESFTEPPHYAGVFATQKEKKLNFFV
jgi:hypothetical protein